MVQMFSALPVTLLLCISPLISSSVLAAPRSQPEGISTTLLRKRSQQLESREDVEAWARKHRDAMVAKYNPGAAARKRSSGTNLIVNQGFDSSYYGSIAVGTPAVSYNVILDTGSSDLWLASSACDNCALLPTFDSSTSSTFQNTGEKFSITYGLGFASGSLGRDVVQMAGFSVTNQEFAVCDNVAEDLLNQPVSGLMGLAYQSIASSGATPFWQSLVQSGAWDQPLMSFQLTRFGDVENANELEAGGSFTMGFVNNSLFTGDIDYQSIPGDPTYWLQTVSAVTVNGNAVSIGSSNLAAIDTGTTLIGGPADAIAAIYAQIPGSEAGTGDLDGYYTYPCNTQVVTVAMAFGGQSWTIKPSDFIARTIPRTSLCMGAFFVNPAGGSAPAWIVGDVFLKNVYSVFRFNPPSVGFAQLSDVALAMDSGDIPVPVPTIGAVVASTTAAAGANREHNSAKGLELPLMTILSSAVAMVTLLSNILRL